MKGLGGLTEQWDQSQRKGPYIADGSGSWDGHGREGSLENKEARQKGGNSSLEYLCREEKNRGLKEHLYMLRGPDDDYNSGTAS